MWSPRCSITFPRPQPEPVVQPPITIPPDVRGRLKRLGLQTRRAIGDRGIGAHASRSRGAGLEFAQYRAYEYGDEPRQIDWKLYARSDKFFVREAERESPIAIWILLDASGSMAQADRATPAWSRFDAAKLLTACVVELAMQQDDRFGWVRAARTGSDAGRTAQRSAATRPAAARSCAAERRAAPSPPPRCWRRCGSGSVRATWSYS